MGVNPSSDTRDYPPAGALPGFLASEVRLAFPATGLTFRLAGTTGRGHRDAGVTPAVADAATEEARA